MRIRLRPYHPTYVVAFFGGGAEPPDFNGKGFEYVLSQIRADRELEVMLVEEHDDVCEHCKRREPDPDGSVWSPTHTCSSAQNPEVVNQTAMSNRKVLDTLGLDYGSIIKFRDLVYLLRERIPVLNDEMTGGPYFQEAYEQGLAALRKFYEEGDAVPTDARNVQAEKRNG